MRMIVGGTMDNGTLRYLVDGEPDNWLEVGLGTGDGGFCGLDPKAGRIFGSGAYLKLFRSFEGQTDPDNMNGVLRYRPPVICANAAAENLRPPPFLIPDTGNKYRTNFVAPFVLDSNVDARLLAGGASLWRTDNFRQPVYPCSGPSWTAIKDPTAPISPISSIAIAAANSNLIWVGHNNGDVFKSDAGASADPRSTWRKMDDNGLHKLPDRVCTRIASDPRNSSVAYATFGEYAADNIWKTIDGGLNWSAISEGLPELPVFSLSIHPQNSDYLFAGTGAGVFASENGGIAWRLIGPTNSPITDLFWIDQTLFAATYGRGMFKIDLIAH